MTAALCLVALLGFLAGFGARDAIGCLRPEWVPYPCGRHPEPAPDPRPAPPTVLVPAPALPEDAMPRPVAAIDTGEAPAA